MNSKAIWMEKISTPALIINHETMIKNIKTMAEFAKNNGIALRPHVKTHKCPKIAKLQMEAGACGICVARIGEAEIFVQHGLKDILIANQVIDQGQIQRLVELNKQASVKVCVDSEKNVIDLNTQASKASMTLEVVLEVDIGLGRNGVAPGEACLNFANFIKKQSHLKLIGLQGYEGHLISVLDHVQLQKQAEDCMKLIIDTRDLLNENGYNITYLTAANSGTYKYSGKCKGITEIQPGTYVFNDEHHLKISPEFEIAATILSTVSNMPMKRIHTIDAGLKAGSNDNGNPILKDYPKSKIRVMTEEHSMIRSGPKETLEIGQKIEIYPTHICTTVNLYDFLTIIKKDGEIERWEILARGKNY